MNMKIENTANKVETGFSRAYAINEHAVQIVNAAIAAGIVKWDGLADMIRDVHKALAEGYDDTNAAGERIDALMASTAPVVAQVEVNADEPAEENVEIAELQSEDAPEVLASEEPEVAAEPVIEISELYPNPWDAVTHEALYCLIDGVAKKELKRYLRSKHGLTFEQYRARFGLPADYPHVCKAASERWSASAKRQGFGSTVTKVPKALREEAAAPAVAEEAAPTPKSTRIVRGRTRARTGSQQAAQVAA